MRATRALAVLAPTVSSTVGLPEDRSVLSVSKSASPLVKLSRYSTITRVASWSARSARRSAAVTSDWLPIETNRETPMPCRCAMAASSEPSCPLWETIAIGPGSRLPHISCVRDLFLAADESRYGYWKGVNVVPFVAIAAGAVTYSLLLNPVTYEPSGLFRYTTAPLPAFVVARLVHYGLTRAVVQPRGLGGYDVAASRDSAATATARPSP